MADPFAAALGALFLAPGSSDAIYRRIGQPDLPIRVIRSRGTKPLGEDMLADVDQVQVRRSDVPMPENGDEIAIGDDLLIVQGGPLLDVEGLSWTCYLTPAT